MDVCVGDGLEEWKKIFFTVAVIGGSFAAGYGFRAICPPRRKNCGAREGEPCDRTDGLGVCVWCGIRNAIGHVPTTLPVHATGAYSSAVNEWKVHNGY